MATWEHDDLLPKGKGGVLDFSDDIGTNDKYSDAIRTLRFYLLAEKKSHSRMWEFLELCHKYSVDLSQMGKVAQTLVFKKHSDKNFDLVDYMQRKGLTITLPSTKTNPSQSGAAGTSTSGDRSKKLKGKAQVKKLNVVTPKKPTTVEAPKKATTETVETPKKATTEPWRLQRKQQQEPWRLQRRQKQEPLRLQRSQQLDPLRLQGRLLSIMTILATKIRLPRRRSVR
ncbi:hypothetical protein R1sor_009872 [Riccia sorocarpa]|uniref:Uncharacterized protein n=1 Tax=Riccia sorocarpa TaxID=122646 RepID=A0ABD3HY33_9MARC